MPSPSVPDWVAALADRAARADGQPPFSDQSLIDLADRRRDLIALGTDAAAIISPDATDAEFVVDPDARRRGLGERMLTTLLERSGGNLHVWAHGDHPAARILAGRHGLTPVRTLLQLRAEVPLRDARLAAPSSGTDLRDTRLTAPSSGTDLPDTRLTAPPSGTDLPDARLTAPSSGTDLPDTRLAAPSSGTDLRDARLAAPSSGTDLPDARLAAPSSGTDVPDGESPGTTVSAFRPGIDDAAWLAVNAAAFASHPEQGKLTQSDLNARKAEDWFDKHDFLLLWDRGALIGFCWLKVDGDVGEFYAVGIAPHRQGEGLGRVLVEAGFARLAERGIRTSNLYVEADNEPALRLYRSYGFRDYTVDVQYASGGILGTTG
ncbi:hypothetical protein GCM10027052_16950 [Parafrigoribacterium mesophilum]|uniref:mycothiol synthase n=1 Tax=Parafrigoribacterium mesophilum TaxID=433646 RepID=UPI0031FC810E